VLLLLLLLLLLLQDLPEGNFRELMASKSKVKDRSPNTLKAALLNYRSWIMCLNYGYCFGVELVVDNVIVYYLVSCAASLCRLGRALQYPLASQGMNPTKLPCSQPSHR
jgi:hypothetical protein